MKYNRMKHIATDIQLIALDTGYDYNFLCERVDELVEDGETYEAAIRSVRDTSAEHDW